MERNVLAEELEHIEAARDRLNGNDGRGSKRAAPVPLAAEAAAEPPEDDPIPFASEEARVRATDDELFGLAFSGGGIRSATFNLGVLQGLAELRLLSRVDYLSTVSGGGYIGAWLTGWIHRSDRGVREVEERLRRSTHASEPAIQFLREHSNYLTPRLGVFSADTWSALSIYLRNLVLNLTILIGVLFAVLLVPRLLFGAFIHVSAGPTTVVGNLADLLAMVFLLPALIVAGVNLRYLRSAATDQGWINELSQQGAIVQYVAFPTLIASFLIAASTARAPSDWSSILSVSASWLVLWLVLVFVWKPWRADVDALGRPLNSRSRWRIALASIFIALVSAVSAAALVVAFSRSALTSDPAVAMVLGVTVVLGIITLSAVLDLGLMSRMVSEEVREWWSRMGGWLLILGLAWSAVSAISLFGPLLLEWAGTRINAPAAAAWLGTTLFGLAAGRSAATGGHKPRRLLELVAAIAPYVFILGLLLALSWFVDWAMGTLFHAGSRCDPSADWSCHWERLGAIGVGPTLLSCAACAVAALLLSWRVDVNDFSLQPLYRNRLVRCYLGASRGKTRRPHPFTGFDPKDDIRLADLGSNGRPPRPFPLINTALNLVKGKDLAWQERKAASFTLSPLHCGFDGYHRPTRAYADGGITLGGAFATSGAAASPNMGYHSSPALAFLMTVFNVRLGVWLGNPKRQRDCWTSTGPRLGLVALLTELFGNTHEDARFVYLSDGGHFENLGIYELVRRRCRFIVACDASADPHVRFDDLAGVVRKCRNDFNVDIQLDPVALERDPEKGRSTYYCAVADIRYPDGATGTLVYLKATLTGREPVDVLNYATADPSFPHQTTADQWFSESQFESYRRLGCQAVSTVFQSASRKAGDNPRLALEGLFTTLRERWFPQSRTANGASIRHRAALDALNERVRANTRLSFLDAQVVPSWPEFMAGTKNAPEKMLWLPDDPEARRDGFYHCVAVLQLMESVYTDLDLETTLDHPDNRGWANLFRHWAWCGMLRVTWALTASTYGARFQSFCRHSLDLTTGEIDIADDAPTASLNFLECELIEQFRRKADAPEDHRVVSIRLRVENPMDSKSAAYFPVGFAIIAGQDLSYLRIQDHLRKMGLARVTLRDLMGRGLVTGLRELREPPQTEGEPSANGAGLRRLVESVAVELGIPLTPPNQHPVEVQQGVAAM